MSINIYVFMQTSLRIEVMADRFGDLKLIFKSKLVSFSTGDGDLRIVIVGFKTRLNHFKYKEQMNAKGISF